MSKGQLAVFVRSRRDALGVTQAQLATTTGWSKSAIEKVEAGSLVPSLEFAGALFDALGIPYMYRERIIAALYPGALDRILGRTAALPDADALADLEYLPYPAAYLMLPEGDILGGNAAWIEAFPESAAKPNLFTYLFTEPSAREALVDWERLAHGFTYGLRMMGPISLSESKLAEIVDRCGAHPDFERMYASDPPLHEALQPVIRVAAPGTGETRELCIKIDKPHLPHSPWLTYRLVPVRVAEPVREGR
ncbi:helix-turn-helix domain-containing protein [Nocardia sp. SYP-A9097]|uniref:helix-turn-helix domain-containing protein n=1 Tax=Nocardia sp. SYP-A9097 TaxID=2663237 RepID=UPI00129B1386|nr:helix-turn-helix domain-containing protein [Nocardia sp. SYP-A9097]MRH86750.1 helix-turn-helix domain-containing protein [Nocardia sp. SYP-A9097]